MLTCLGCSARLEAAWSSNPSSLLGCPAPSAAWLLNPPPLLGCSISPLFLAPPCRYGALSNGIRTVITAHAQQNPGTTISYRCGWKHELGHVAGLGVMCASG